jgi:hypothetical protein
MLSGRQSRQHQADGIAFIASQLGVSAHIRLHQTVPAVEGGATAVRPAMLSLRAGQLLLFLTRRLASMVSWALGL